MTTETKPYEWGSTHAPTCPVTAGRASLLADLDHDPGNLYLEGAVPEYEYGGDQEAELCDCGVVAIAQAAVGAMTILFRLTEERGLCFDVLVREAIEAGEARPR